MRAQSKRNAEQDPSAVVTKGKLKAVGRNCSNRLGALRQQEKLCSAIGLLVETRGGALT